MRRVITLVAVLVVTSFISGNEASAIGWRGQWRGARYQSRGCPSAAVVTHREESPVRATMSATTVASNNVVQTKPAVEADDSKAVARILDVIEEIIRLENDRLDRELESLEEDYDDYGSG